ncbi:MAG TPA: YbaB/EbfC family nucleoid-associated protein [Firmicutes bacterium]|nr:YbaB/EbfC family nucleoid-associated protein [Bacillota bacterium]
MGKMMKQMQKLQAKMAQLQEELAQRTVEASAGGGAVTVKVNGENEVLEVKIDPDVVDPEDVEMLEDLILAATNEALRLAREMVAEEMGKLTGGLNLPPGLI